MDRLGLSRRVDLGEEGLSPGDNVSPYIDEFWIDGNEVHIPPGSYTYDGSGLNGERGDCSLIGSEDGVEFHRPGPSASVRPFVRATHGVVRVENITVRGVKPARQSRWRFDATDPSARIEVVNVNHPDGSVDGSDSLAFYTGKHHRGEVLYKNCYIGPHGNSSIYANVGSEGAGANAPVYVDNCVFIDPNNIIRAGHNGSRYTNLTCVWRGTPNGWKNGSWYARGIRADDPHEGDGMLIENAHFYFGDSVAGNCGGAIEVEGVGDFSGTIRDIYIHTESDCGGIFGSLGDFDIENVNATGPGAPVQIDKGGVGQGSTPPDLKNENVIWMPESQTVRPGDGAPPPDGGGGPPDELARLEIRSLSSRDFDYLYSIDGFTQQHPDDQEPNDTARVVSEDPLRMAAEGRTGSNSQDVWEVNGEITSWQADADDGQPVAPGEDVVFVVDGETLTDLVGVVAPDGGDGAPPGEEAGIGGSIGVAVGAAIAGAALRSWLRRR